MPVFVFVSVITGVYIPRVPRSDTSLTVVPLLPLYLRQNLLLFSTDYTRLAEHSASREFSGSHPMKDSLGLQT